MTDDMKANSLLEETKDRFKEIILANRITDEPVQVRANPLTPREAIGIPKREDFPILIGRERMLEAVFKDAKGHAFTDAPDDFEGTLSNVLDLPLDSNRNRAILIATMNAVLRSLNKVEGTVHCKDEDPEKCAHEIADHVLKHYGKVHVGLIGLNPAIAESLAETFGSEKVLISDLNPDNVGKMKFGVNILDGQSETSRLITQSDVLIVTGTTLGNETIDSILTEIQSQRKKYLLYGVTCASVCKLLDLPRICPYGYND